MQKTLAWTVVMLLSFVSAAHAQNEPRIESNVVYGMYSGLALLMDVHYPPEDHANGKGIIFIQGCGWHQPLAADAGQLKEGGAIEALAKPLAQQGFTVFTVNHRAAPRFRYPAALEDVQRAVQFIRYHHEKYGIAPERIAAVGGSSGGHLSSLLGLLPSVANSESADPVEQQDSNVQCVVALAPATHLFADDVPGTTLTVFASFLGEPLFPADGTPAGIDPIPKVYRLASPITHASDKAAAFLLIHGEEDTVVGPSQSSMLAEKLREKEAVAEFIKVEDVGHGIPPLVASGKDGTSPEEIGAWIQRRLSR